MKKTRFLIVTPSLNRLDDLKRCIASVRDQVAPEGDAVDGCPLSVDKGAINDRENDSCLLSVDKAFPTTQHAIRVHHHIQDGGSSDGTVEFLKKFDTEAGSQKSKVSVDLRSPTSDFCPAYTFSYSSERDAGMYDAISKAWARGMRAPINGDLLTVSRNAFTNNQSLITNNCDDVIVAWLNCDEQYLEGALERVAGYFQQHPETDVLFGDVLVVRPGGSLLCARRAMLPERRHMLTSYLTVFSAAMFLRADAVKTYVLYPDPQWKVLGDVDMVDRMISAGVRFGMLNRFVAAFTDSGENISLTSDQIQCEQQTLATRLSPVERAFKPLWTFQHRMRKVVSGAYRPLPVSHAVYANDLSQRTDFTTDAAPTVWKGRL